MSLGARPLREHEVERIWERKVADFRHKARRLGLRHMNLDSYFEAAAEDSEVRLAVETGFISDLASELRDPVLVRIEDQLVMTCPSLALRVLADEPPQLHRAFVEGAFLRKFLRLFVPATHEGGETWEVTGQVRDIMRRHFAFQLVACEELLRMEGSDSL